MKELTDTLECGVEATLDNIGNLLLCDDSNLPIPPSQFVGSTEALCKARLESLNM